MNVPPLPSNTLDVNGQTIPVYWVHTLIVGSGAAGLNAAVQLRMNGVQDLMILTEGLDMGTSINTGSDKQTYYKLSMSGDEPDSCAQMARDICAAGSMHGDLALVEASQSARSFLHLVNLGIPFPQNEFGQFVGYKTDHDPRRRATSVGPYTSREMCLALIRRVRELSIPVLENRNVVEIITTGLKEEKRSAGVVAVDSTGRFEVFGAENLVFAVGGPGGLYAHSVYPEQQTGAIGLALLVGAKAQSLPESQFGIASTKVRWCVSGSFMQSIPRFISTDPDGTTNEREFLHAVLDPPARLHSLTFLKGYQWPFDARKAINGSSILDIFVDLETQKDRRVFLDFRQNPAGFDYARLDPEVGEFLHKSNAVLHSPVERLRQMNPAAYSFYLEHGIDLQHEPLEVRVCAQHNNGGLAANHWWESENIRHFFPIGEVNGSHGIARPGGTALNAGQVGGARAAEFIAHRYADWTVDRFEVLANARQAVESLVDWSGFQGTDPRQNTWQAEWSEIRGRMSRSGAHIRNTTTCTQAVEQAQKQWQRLCSQGCAISNPAEIMAVLRVRQLCYAHLVYLKTILYQLESGVGSRGSSIIVQNAQNLMEAGLPHQWSIQKENPAFQDQVLETIADPGEEISVAWASKRPIPEVQSWFETDWERYRSGKIYTTDGLANDRQRLR